MVDAGSLKILFACEESDEVRGRFEAMGFDAWSCDLQPSRNPKAKHLQCNALDIINDGWHGLIGFPPCTHLAVSGTRHFPIKRKDGRQQQGIDFFMGLANAPIKHISLENPVGIMSTLYKKPTQIIQPYFFGDQARKTTCLWLKNFPKLFHNAEVDLFAQETTHVSPGEFFEFINKKTGKKERQPLWYAQARRFGGGKGGNDYSRIRSKTFAGIAEAMAVQWGEFLINSYSKPL